MQIETPADYRAAVLERDALEASLDDLTAFAVKLEGRGHVSVDTQNMIDDMRSELRGKRDELQAEISSSRFHGDYGPAEMRAWHHSRVGVVTGRAA